MTSQVEVQFHQMISNLAAKTGQGLISWQSSAFGTLLVPREGYLSNFDGLQVIVDIQAYTPYTITVVIRESGGKELLSMPLPQNHNLYGIAIQLFNAAKLSSNNAPAAIAAINNFLNNKNGQ